MMAEAERTKAEAEKLLAEAKRLMPAVAPTEPEKPVEEHILKYRSHKQTGKQKPVEAPTKPVEHTGFTRFNYSEAKQKIREEMQLEQRIAEAQNLYDDQSDGYDKDIEADIEV